VWDYRNNFLLFLARAPIFLFKDVQFVLVPYRILMSQVNVDLLQSKAHFEILLYFGEIKALSISYWKCNGKCKIYNAMWIETCEFYILSCSTFLVMVVNDFGIRISNGLLCLGFLTALQLMYIITTTRYEQVLFCECLRIDKESYYHRFRCTFTIQPHHVMDVHCAC
jgi:hypothetical protein